MPLAAGRFSDDVHHAPHRAIAVAGRRRAANNVDMVNHFRRYPAGITARVAVSAPAIAHGVTTGHRFTVHQYQRVLWPHPANIDLAVIAALTAGGVARQVDAGLGTNQFGDVAGGWMFADFIGGDGGDAGGLESLRGRGNHHRFVVVLRCGCRSGFLRFVWRAVVSGLRWQPHSPDSHMNQHGQRVV